MLGPLDLWTWTDGVATAVQAPRATVHSQPLVAVTIASRPVVAATRAPLPPTAEPTP